MIGKLLLLAVVLVALVVMIKRTARGRRSSTDSVRIDPAPLTPLSEAQQRIFTRLQSAMPSTMILVHPALSQLLNGRDDGSRSVLERRFVDFAVCRRDSTPIGVVMLDDADASTEALVKRAGLRYATFRSHPLPSEREIRDALGFIG
ncbi:hypothetical protein BH09PSE6_BH09PSE6_33110 [soil metagenome]